MFRSSVAQAIDDDNEEEYRQMLNEAPEIQKTLMDMNLKKNALAETQHK